jgi:membrane fusion protein
MSVTLFRQQAVEEQRVKPWGETRLAAPISFVMMTAFLAACIVALAVFAATATYARKERGQGFLAPARGLVRIMPPRGGVIIAVHVTEGQIVQQGAPLLTISASQSNEAGQNVDASMLDALRRQRDQLQVQIDLGRRKAATETRRLRDQAEGLAAELAALEAERRVQLGRIQGTHQQAEAGADLAGKGYVSQPELKRRQDNYYSQLQGETSLTRQIAAKQAEFNQARDALSRLPLDTAERASQLEMSVADLDSKLVEIEGRRGYLLTAPTSGRVSALQASVGKIADPVIPQLSIVPEGAVLRAELFLPARAIGFAAQGQTVRLRYDAFPYQQFGTAEGVVETVSHTLLRPAELVGPVSLTNSAYRVTVTLRRQTVTAYGNEVPLQADMLVMGDILFERRSLLAWLLDPLASAWRKS